MADQEKASEPEVVQVARPVRNHAMYQGWAWGAALVILGSLALLQNFGVIKIIEIHNWWAFFLLIPTVGAFSAAFGMWLANGHKLTRPVLAAAWGGMFPLIVAIIFLFNLDWGKVWPIFIVMAGVSSLMWAGKR